MQVILLETIKNLGDLGSVVDVRPGYGRNFLIPQGKALPATKNNLAEVEERRAELEKQAAELLSAAEARAEKLAEAPSPWAPSPVTKASCSAPLAPPTSPTRSASRPAWPSRKRK